MLKGVRNVFFTVVMALLLSCVTISLGLVETGAEFPADFHIGDTKSMLEGREYAKWEKPTRAKLLDGSWQAGFESFVSDHVPMRDSALLLNALLERRAIALAAALFGYETMPTFYGSGFFAVPADGVVVEGPVKAPGPGGNLDRFLAMLNSFAAAHPDAGMAVRLVTEPRHTKANPAYALTSGNHIDEDWAQREMVDRLDPALNAAVDGVWDYGGLKDAWYKTDVHWTARRALESYGSIADALGLKRVAWDDGSAVTVKDRWYGAAARSGRDYDAADELVDLDIDFPNLHYHSPKDGRDGDEISTGLRESFLRGRISSSDIPVSGLNGVYFGGKSYDIYNDGDNNGKTCLVIGDSFVRPMYRYIADNYARTVVLLPGNRKTKGNLEGLFEEYGADDLVVVMHCQKYDSIASTSPAFMDLG